jgi:DNA-binding HxlR family transcriptional regulator
MTFFKGLNKSFENRVRLGIMSTLVVNDEMDFTSLKNLLGVTDGNLASHMSVLVDIGYVIAHKEFRNNKPWTSYEATKEGKLAFEAHLLALERILKNK